MPDTIRREYKEAISAADRDQALKAIQQAESSLRITQFAVDHASDSLFWITPDAHFAQVNESACHRLGYSREELLRLTVFDVDPAFPREAWAAHWQEVKERKAFSIETRHRKKNGEVFPVEVRVNYVEYDGAEYNFAFARDITDRKRAEEALRAANEALEGAVAERTAALEKALLRLQQELEDRRRVEERLQITQFSVDSSADVIFWVRPDGSYAYWNRAACQLLGYSSQDFLHLKTFDLNPDHQGAAWQVHWAELRESGFLRFETMLRRKDGVRLPVEITANHVLGNDQEFNCAFVRDLSERKQIEDDLRRLNEELEQRVRQRTTDLEAKNAELEKMNKLFVGRELRMIELKERIKELEGKQ